MANRYILLFIFNLIYILSSAQHTAKIYFTKNWIKTLNQKDAEYYRIINFDSNNKPEGTVKDYYMNGKLQYEAVKTYADTIDIKQDTTEGYARWYSIKGTMTRESFYKNGKLEGEQKQWYENGNLRGIRHFTNDTLQGEYKLWFETGEIKVIANYKNGFLEGDYTSYYINGNYFKKIKYKQGVIEGKQFVYYDQYLNKYASFFDEFTLAKDPYGWNLPEGNGVISSIKKDTGLYIQNNTTNDIFALIELPFNANGRFEVNINIKKDSGSPEDGYGIVYDYKDENNYSYFIIKSSGYFLTGRKLSGQETTKEEWKKTKKLLGNNKFDKLSVDRNGIEMHFYINHDKVSVDNFYPFSGNKFGVICLKGNHSVILSSLAVYQ